MRILNVNVLPLYGQLELGDPKVAGYPQFESGEEPLVALPHRIVVATQSDVHGKIPVEIWQGEIGQADLNGYKLIFDGALVLSEELATVGNTVGNEFYKVALGKGNHDVRVLVRDSTNGASAVIIVVDPIIGL